MLVTLLASVGCATTHIVERKPIPSPGDAPVVQKKVAVGIIVDSRPREGQNMLNQKDVRIGMARIKNTMAQILESSGRFAKLGNIPIEITGENVDEMVEIARTLDCELLLVGEVDQFDIKSLGNNSKMLGAVLLEGLTGPVGIITFLITDMKCGAWVNGMIETTTAEVILSMSLRLIDVGSGRIVAEMNPRTTVTKPVNYTVYGDLAQPSDDWVDIGKELGEVAIHNISVDIIEQLTQILSPK
jgi:hypothetical protein